MPSIMLRFDLRNPAFADVSSSERLRAALDMAAWADSHGGVAVSISEHHASEDSYLPSPLTFAAAVAARTEQVGIVVSALATPFYDPIRLAEDLAVIDNLSGGRLTVVLGAGYLSHEFDMFGVPSNERGARVERAVETMRKAWTGKPFEYEGRTISRVTPVPDRPGGPTLILGGSSEAAARRAARLGLGYVPSTPESWEAYRRAVVEQGGDDPGPSTRGAVVTTCVAEDPEAGWDELLPYFCHECNSYGEWLASEGFDGPYRAMEPDELRASGQYRIITPDECRAELDAMGTHAVLGLHPMVGGLPPDRSWQMLELIERTVLA
jgi:alkanesulfonate monooxygenase SsuD/methylene tetrahydromethanopterin reductase-like flavin-dependent oxidoreductase (luciferase family)